MEGCRRTSKNAEERTPGTKTVAEKIGCRHRIAQPPDQMRRGQRGKQGPGKSTNMTDNLLKSLVTEAVSLDREINEKSERLKEL